MHIQWTPRLRAIDVFGALYNDHQLTGAMPYQATRKNVQQHKYHHTYCVHTAKSTLSFGHTHTLLREAPTVIARHIVYTSINFDRFRPFIATKGSSRSKRLLVAARGSGDYSSITTGLTCAVAHEYFDYCCGGLASSAVYESMHRATLVYHSPPKTAHGEKGERWNQDVPIHMIGRLR